MKYSYKTLAKIAPEVVEKVVKFAVERYGADEDWWEDIWLKRSFYEIARKHFKEYIDFIDGVAVTSAEAEKILDKK